MIESATTLFILLLVSVELNCFLFLIMQDNKEMYRTRLLQAGIHDSFVTTNTVGRTTSGEELAGAVADAPELEQPHESFPKPALGPDSEHLEGEQIPEQTEAHSEGTESVDLPKDLLDKDDNRFVDEEENAESPFSEYFRKLKQETEEKDQERWQMCLRILREKKEMERSLLRGEDKAGEQEEGQIPEAGPVQEEDRGDDPTNAQVHSQEEQESPNREIKNQEEAPENAPEKDREPEAPVDADGEDKDERIRAYTQMKAGHFMVHGMSVQGRGHLIDATPCQDFHYVDTVGDDVLIVAVSDGAGSKANSEYGSSIVCKKAVKYLKEAVSTLKWKDGNWPDSKTWNSVFRKIVALVQGELGRHAKEEGRPFDSLAATLMVLLVTPGKSYFAHVGDGRAGVLTPDGWKAVMTPHTGAESNQTVFMTNRILDPGLEISGVSVPETAVLKDPISAFVLMSDGLENGFWTKNRKVTLPDGDFRYKKMNVPFEPALNDVLDRISKCDDGKERDLFFSILDHYNAPLKSETDDKTLCLAYTLPETDKNN